MWHARCRGRTSAVNADLHTHTARSDGLLAPAELVRQAAAAGLACLALTDHDSLAGIAEATAAAQAIGLRLVPGVELSVRDSQRNEEHLLGFFIDPASPDLQRYLHTLQDARRQMAEQTLHALRQLGLPLSAERVAELAAGAVVTRPHIARAMVEAGYVSDEREAFDRYLGNGRPAAPERPSPSPSEAIATIRAAGGVAGLAHPIFPQDAGAAERQASLSTRLDGLSEAGLQAIECFYPDAPAELRAELAQLAQRRGLLATGGTDYHGPGKAPYAELGQVSVDTTVVADLERLSRHHP